MPWSFASILAVCVPLHIEDIELPSLNTMLKAGNLSDGIKICFIVPQAYGGLLV